MRFLGAGLLTAAGTLGGYAAEASASSSGQAWRLDPDPECAPERSCSDCSACRNHAANKLFASAAAADANRAHTYCKCHVAPLAVLDRSVYDALFVAGGARASVDRRHQWVQAVLAQTPALATISDGTVHAVGRHVFMRRKTNGTRTLYVDVEAAEPVTATIAIMRNGATLAEKTVSGPRGRKRRKLEIPGTVKSGPARLRLVLRNAAGDVDIFTRAIEIPKVWPVSR